MQECIYKYTLEMMECPTSRGSRKRKRNMRNTTTLDMQGVDIIVYDFIVTKVGRLRKSTIDIIKEKLLSLQGFTDRRQTRSSTHDLEWQYLIRWRQCFDWYIWWWCSDSYEKNNSWLYFWLVELTICGCKNSINMKLICF